MHFLDTSAFLKLLVAEPESAALEAYLGDGLRRGGSVLLEIETIRAIRRFAPQQLDQARAALRQIQLVPIDGTVVQSAAMLNPEALRSLDAIHLATAISAGDLVTSFVTYDRQLAAAADQAGLRAVAPGAA